MQRNPWQPEHPASVIGHTSQVFVRTPLASDGRVRLATLRRLVEAADRADIPEDTIVNGVYDPAMVRDVAIELRADMDIPHTHKETH